MATSASPWDCRPSWVAPLADGGFGGARGRRLIDGLTRYVERGEIPGALALVRHRDEEVLFAQIGKAADEHDHPIARDTLFRIGSMTKPIVTAAAMTLVEEGRLRLSDRVSQWLPELAAPKVLPSPGAKLSEAVPAPRPITVEDLLLHLPGFATALVAQGDLGQAVQVLTAGLAQRADMEPDAWMRALGELPLARAPGEEVINGFATDVLGVLLSRLTGQSLPDLLKSRILEPLGMADTDFWAPPEKAGRLCPAYVVQWLSGKRKVVDDPANSAFTRQPAFPSGSGGLVSSLDDYTAFGRMMLNGGELDGRRVLSRASVRLMTTNFLTPEQRALPFFGYPYWADRGLGLGLYVLDDLSRHRGLGREGQYGWGGAFATTWFNDPAENLTAVLMTQVAFAAVIPNIRSDFETLVYQAIDA
ncbi:MAG: class A beta-lactamase-related serine hydrolase [Caulobacteraceae bacterium]|nr:MAG: class A beta-lactamase-related serine hydrolase [Caulobacteraceae bacterium]